MTERDPEAPLVLDALTRPARALSDRLSDQDGDSE